MANSIGSVFIDLKADTSHLVNGFNRAEKMAQKTTDMLVKMAGAVGLAWGGLEIKNFIDQQAEVAKGASLVAEQYAISVEELTKYHYIAEKAGVSQEKFNDALKDAGTKVTEFQRDGESAKEAFKALGISQDFAKKHMQTSSETMDVLLKKFAEFPDGMQKATIAQEIFGDEGANVIRVANLGADAMARYGEEAIKGNIAVSEAFAQKSKSYLEAEHRLDQLRSGWAAAVIEESNFLEMGTNMYTIIGDAVVEWTGDVQSGTDTFVDGLQTISNATNAVFPTVIEMGGMVGGAFVSMGGAVWGVGETIVDLVGKLIGFDEQSNSNISTLGHFSGLAIGASMAVENFSTLIEFSSKGFETFGIAIQTYAISRLDYLQSAFYSTMASGSDLLAFFDDDFESDAQAYRQKAVKYDNAMVQALATGNGRLASIAKEREDLLKKVHSSDMIQAKMEETAYKISVKQREGFAKNSENLAKKLEDDFEKSGKESLKRLEATMKALEKGKNKSVSISKSTLAHQKGLESNARAYEKEQKEQIRLQKELNDEMARMQDEHDRAYMDYLKITGKKEKLFDLETEKILERFKSLGYSEEKLEEIEDARWEKWAENGMEAIDTVEEKSNQFSDHFHDTLTNVFDSILDGANVFDTLLDGMDSINQKSSQSTSDSLVKVLENGGIEGIFSENGTMTNAGYSAMATAGHLFAQEAFGDSKMTQAGSIVGGAVAGYFSAGNPAVMALGSAVGEIVFGIADDLLGGKHSTRIRINSDGSATEVDHKSGGIFSHSSNRDVGDATVTVRSIEYQYESLLNILGDYNRDLTLSVGTHKNVMKEYQTEFFNSLAGVSQEHLDQTLITRNVFTKDIYDKISQDEWVKIELGNGIKKSWEQYAKSVDKEVREVLAETFGNLEQTENAIFEFNNRDDVDAIYKNRIAKGEQYERELEALYASGQDVTLENYKKIRDGITDPEILNGYIALEQQLLSNAQVANEYADVLEDASEQVTSAYNDMIASLAQADHSRVMSIYGQIDQYEASIASYSDTLIQESQNAYKAQIDYAKKVTAETSKMYSTAVTSFEKEISKLMGVGKTDDEKQFDQIVQFNQKQSELERLLSLDSVDQNQLNSVYGDLLNLSDSLGMDTDLNGSILDLLRGDIDLFGSTSTQAVVEYTESSAVASRNNAQYAEIQAQMEQLELLRWMVEDDRSVYMTERGFVENFRDQEHLTRYQTRALYEIAQDRRIEYEELKGLEGIFSEQQMEAIWEQTNLERSNTDRIVDAINNIKIINGNDSVSRAVQDFRLPSQVPSSSRTSSLLSGGFATFKSSQIVLKSDNSMSELIREMKKTNEKLDEQQKELSMIKKASVAQVNESREFRWSQENISALGGSSGL